jgi:hypothetical protein
MMCLLLFVWAACGIFACDDYDRWSTKKYGQPGGFASKVALMFFGPVALVAAFMPDRT